jgi:transposase-like protein
MHDYGVYADAVDIVFDEKELEDSNVEEDEHTTISNSHKFRNLTDTQRQQIYEALLERSNCGKLKKNTTNIVAQIFQVSRYQVRRVWRRVKQCRAQGIPVDVRSRRKNCGRKRKQIDLSDVLRVPLHRRRTIRSLANAIGVKKSTLHRWFKGGHLRRHSSTLKPLLREDNKKDRLRWCLSMLDERTLPNEPKFREMYNIIHMDEKWFNTTSKYVTYYMHPEEDDPHRTVHNKNRIGKVMFLLAVGRPIYDDAGNCIFDGKLGVWPFVRKVRRV